VDVEVKGLKSNRKVFPDARDMIVRGHRYKHSEGVVVPKVKGGEKEQTEASSGEVTLGA
jgi:hypothetical protein